MLFRTKLQCVTPQVLISDVEKTCRTEFLSQCALSAQLSFILLVILILLEQSVITEQIQQPGFLLLSSVQNRSVQP